MGAGVIIRRREELDDIENEFMEISRNELINFIEHKEVSLLTRKTARRREQCMKLLWCSAKDVRHVLL